VDCTSPEGMGSFGTVPKVGFAHSGEFTQAPLGRVEFVTVWNRIKLIYFQFDALMMAPREDIGLNRFAPDGTLVTDIAILFDRHKKFSLRDPNKVRNGEAKAKLEQLICKVLDKKLTFDFMSTDEIPISGQKLKAGTTLQARFSCIQTSDMNIYFGIHLSYQMLLPLMSGKLNSAEKLMEKFFVAQVLIHELIVR
jgi:hypothetical protein